MLTDRPRPGPGTKGAAQMTAKSPGRPDTLTSHHSRKRYPNAYHRPATAGTA
jgi:hypothetical protein